MSALLGSDWGWGADAREAQRIFDTYVERGGNFIDTAVNYTHGSSEKFLGELIRHKRERIVLATKFTMAGWAVAKIASETNSTQSQVALAWTLRHPAVVSPIVGARTAVHAEDNFGALDLRLTGEQLERLARASVPAPIFPARFMSRPMTQQLMFGGTTVLDLAPYDDVLRRVPLPGAGEATP